MFGATVRGRLATREGSLSQDSREFRKTRDCQSIAGFSFGNQPPRRAGKRKESRAMNERYRKLRTSFGPETRFRVKAITQRDEQTTELEQLKGRLLGQLLGQVGGAQQDTILRRAANDAAALAWASGYPLLLFPALLDELAETGLLRARRQKQLRQRSQDLA